MDRAQDAECWVLMAESPVQDAECWGLGAESLLGAESPKKMLSSQC